MPPKLCSCSVLKDNMLTAWYRSSIVSLSFQRRTVCFCTKIQGTLGTLRKTPSTGGERHKMPFHWCYSDGCPQCLWPDQGREAACTCDLSGYVFTWPWNAKSCTRCFSCCTQEVHGLLGSLMDALEVKKAPLSIYCTLGWFPRAAKIQASVKTDCCERDSLWQKYSCDL